VPGTPYDAEFERLLHAVVERHALACRLRAAAPAAEQALASAVRTGDAVRRAVRGGAPRPDGGDCAALASLAHDLDGAIGRAAGEDAAVALRAAVAAGEGARAARHAVRVFVDLAAPRELPAFVHRPVQVRRRAGRGETLVHPEDLAQELAAASRDGIRGAPAGATELPEALVLSPSFAACGAEIALRRGAAELREALVEDAGSGDLLAFTAVPGPFEVALAAAADDEWWAASPIGYGAYRARLEQALDALGVACAVVGDPA
jgi:hypothetical protein